MIRLKNILNEAYDQVGRSKPIDMEETLKLFKNHCQYYVNISTPIYRGVYDSRITNYAYLISPAQHKRISANTENYYTLLIDNSPLWKDYPKRSESIVCSTSQAAAFSYGSVNWVIPFVGSKIGMCPQNDMWVSFDKMNTELDVRDLGVFNNLLSSAYYHLVSKELVPFKGLNGKDANQFFQQLKEFDKPSCKKAILEWSIKADSHSYKEYKIFTHWNNSGLNFTEYLLTLLDPKSNGFELVKAENFSAPQDTKRGNEVWTDGDCLLIPDKNYDDFMKMIKQ